ncbi:AraC family transcriptional regulator [Pandoraea sputorum]|uniref:Multiple antibiotic resistance protein marA n=1 Tax=Pandoraea sputorum TaxID=93222 RepID=A0A239SEF9_9BURK|nr:AraC family transcriptional regulator [Pandoraea sputorum]AJC16651.1 AraC family transcriptional regulator [Pandoraea sputorum]SNU83787.1 Multiple antibiotic resistance protein marA [Pandoraea sputorum]VVD95187.1 AraC family transcriptional regulator [Pandoraea sputorum]
MKPQTRLRYAERMEPVLRWLAAHPESDPDLHHLAELACLSPYHFHRVYRALLGETVNNSVQRIRMHRAAIALSGSEDSMRVVASRAGYASDAAFNRAFGAFFGIPPGRYRDARSGPVDPQELAMYPISVESFPATTLAVLRHQGDYQGIGPVFTRAFMLAAAQGLARPDATGFGVYFDDPEQVPVAQLRSLAGMSVPADAEIGGDLERFEIPAGKCAMLTYTGPYNEMNKPYQWLFAQWLPASGLEPADFPMFEQYLNDPRSTPAAQLQTRICLPVK